MQHSLTLPFERLKPRLITLLLFVGFMKGPPLHAFDARSIVLQTRGDFAKKVFEDKSKKMSNCFL
jgi:hypothetical protein